jgi:ketosteroid isomerase-like protein
VVDRLDDNKRTVLRYFELLTRNDVGGLMAIYDESMTLHVSGNTLTSGTYSKAQLAELAGLVVNVFPTGLELTVTGMVAEATGWRPRVESRRRPRVRQAGTTTVTIS